MGFFQDLFGGGGGGGGGGGYDQVPQKGQRTENEWVQLPDYPEATGARENWWSTLQKWQTEPGYGAIQPDWNSIWENARGKVSRYFGGGPEGPGIDSKVKAGLARRGMSENPASDALLQRSGFQQGNMLQDLAVEQATKQAELGEQGRTTWLSSLMHLAGLKPRFALGSTTTDQYNYAPAQSESPGGFDLFQFGTDLLGDFTGGGEGGDILSGISKIFGSGGVDTGIGDILSGGGEGGDILSEITDLLGGGGEGDGLDLGSIAQLAMMFA